MVVFISGIVDTLVFSLFPVPLLGWWGAWMGISAHCWVLKNQPYAAGVNPWVVWVLVVLVLLWLRSWCCSVGWGGGVVVGGVVV